MVSPPATGTDSECSQGRFLEKTTHAVPWHWDASAGKRRKHHCLPVCPVLGQFKAIWWRRCEPFVTMLSLTMWSQSWWDEFKKQQSCHMAGHCPSPCCARSMRLWPWRDGYSTARDKPCKPMPRQDLNCTENHVLQDTCAHENAWNLSNRNVSTLISSLCIHLFIHSTNIYWADSAFVHRASHICWVTIINMTEILPGMMVDSLFLHRLCFFRGFRLTAKLSRK